MFYEDFNTTVIVNIVSYLNDLCDEYYTVIYFMNITKSCLFRLNNGPGLVLLGVSDLKVIQDWRWARCAAAARQRPPQTRGGLDRNLPVRVPKPGET